MRYMNIRDIWNKRISNWRSEPKLLQTANENEHAFPAGCIDMLVYRTRLAVQCK
jgi:hypothetical protein